jgi:ribosomal protein S19E (S16A)
VRVPAVAYPLAEPSWFVRLASLERVLELAWNIVLGVVVSDYGQLKSLEVRRTKICGFWWVFSGSGFL